MLEIQVNIINSNTDNNAQIKDVELTNYWAVWLLVKLTSDWAVETFIILDSGPKVKTSLLV